MAPLALPSIDIREIDAPVKSWPAPDPADVEWARLVTEIAEAKAQAADLRSRIAVRRSAVKAALRAEFVVARRVLGDMEREHESKIAAIRAAAAADVKRIRAEANGTSNGTSDGRVAGAPDVY